VGKFDEAFLLFEKLSKQMMIDACFISFFFFFCHKTANSQERKGRSIDRSIEGSERHLFSSSPPHFISFCEIFARERVSNDISSNR